MDKLRILPKTTLFLILFLVWIFFKSVPFVIVSLAFASLSFFERYLKIKIPTSFSFCFVVFVILSLVLGSYWWFYEKFSWWDDMLHFSYWVGFSVIWYLLILVMWRKAWIEKHYVLIVIFSFCFSVCFWFIFLIKYAKNYRIWDSWYYVRLDFRNICSTFDKYLYCSLFKIKKRKLDLKNNKRFF